MTLFSIFALRGRDRDNPSLRGRSNENYEQRMELIGRGQTCTITSVQKDNSACRDKYRILKREVTEWEVVK